MTPVYPLHVAQSRSAQASGRSAKCTRLLPCVSGKTLLPIHKTNCQSPTSEYLAERGTMPRTACAA